jgi:PAS domain S-box-containing protein
MSQSKSASLHAEVQDRFGVLPNFFTLAGVVPEITANLWGFAKFAYLDNPLPSLFKERLFVYLSRFCDVRYCIARHFGFLVGLGRPSGDRQCPPETVDQVVRLLRFNLPRGDDLGSHLTRLEEGTPLTIAPGSGTRDEKALFACATHVFLQTPEAARCLGALQHIFDGATLQHLIVFLAFVRTAHYWTKVHPELGFEDDVKQLIATHEALAECVLTDPEAAGETAQVILEELHALRREQAVRDEMERSLPERWPALGAAVVPMWAKDADAARTLLASIVESSDDAIISKDLSGTITSWNRGAERLFGYSAAEAVGQSVTMLIPPERRDEEPGILARVKRGERIDHYETVRRRKDRTLVDVSLVVSPILDATGNVIGVSKIARDITERRRAEEMREEILQVANSARSAAETASRAKDEFLAMLGHELRNPLSAVRNAITAATLDPGNRDRALMIACRQTEQLRRIVDDLLDVSRISQGNVRLRKEPVLLAELLQRTIDGAQATMEEKGHILTLSVSAEPMYVDGDASRLEQAVGNLLANAAKYTDPGGSIALAAERDGRQVVIRVRDNGIGIAPEILPRVFDLFAQAERSLDRSAGGLGIGLTLARRIVELHGGTVNATSSGLGRGAEFIVRLPALERVPNAVALTLADTPRGQLPKARGARILMVEDHPDAAESLMILLELLGHKVRIVHDGVAALVAARANPPEVMLIDIGLPGMNGYEVAQAIRQDPTLRHIMLVALTGYGQPEDTATALAAGFDYHLVKPVDPDALGRLVDRLTTSAATADEGTRH